MYLFDIMTELLASGYFFGANHSEIHVIPKDSQSELKKKKQSQRGQIPVSFWA